ncbi:MAG: hypothetical protein Tsb0015_09140 [Simkaniaceae bacterium]
MKEISPSIKEHLSSLIFFGALSLFVIYLAGRKGFFKFGKAFPKNPISLKKLLWVFGGYFLIAFLIAPFFVKLIILLAEDLTRRNLSNQILWITLIQSISALLTAMYLIFIFYKKLHREQAQLMWNASKSSPIKNLIFGMSIWCVSFPLVSFFYELADIFNIILFGREGPEQSAVIYLKMALDSPLLFVIALTSVIVAAPFIEEILFRGFLHGYLRSKVGVKATILLSSFIFSLFHFSMRQEIGNLPLLLSLFIFALFLGFIYERQKTLWACIGLHMMFNAISVLRIFFIDFSYMK